MVLAVVLGLSGGIGCGVGCGIGCGIGCGVVCGVICCVVCVGGVVDAVGGFLLASYPVPIPISTFDESQNGNRDRVRG